MDFTLPNRTIVQRDAMLVRAHFLYNHDPMTGMNYLAVPYNSTTSETSYFIIGLPDAGTGKRKIYFYRKDIYLLSQ